MPIISTVVSWQGASFNVNLDTASPVEEFRLQLQALTGVPCARQKIMGFPGGVLKASSWDDVAIKGNKICVIMSGESEAAAAAVPSVEASAPEVSQPSQPINVVGISSSSRDATMISVTVKTTQNSIMRLLSIPADTLVGRIKVLLSQPPYSCGQPVAMKLIYKGEPAATLARSESSLVMFHRRAISACSIMRDDISLAAAGYVEHQSLILVVSSSQTPASAPAPLADQDTPFMAALRALDEGTGGGMNYLGRYLALGEEHKRTGVEPAAVTRGYDLMMQRFERRRAGRGTLSVTIAKKRALSREDDHEECPVDVIPPCAPPGAGGLGHESLASDPLLQSIHRVLMQIHPDMNIERSAIILAADLLRWTVFSYASRIDPTVRLKHDLSCASDRSAASHSLQTFLPSNIFEYASKEVETIVERLKNCGKVDPGTWGVSDTGLQVELSTIVSSCEQHRLQISHSAAVPISAVGEYIAAEFLELSGVACKSRGQHQRCITVGDIKKGINDDEELKELFRPFWTARSKVSFASALSSRGAVSNARKKARVSTDTRHVFKLKSDRDEYVTILDIGYETLKQSEVLSALESTADADCIVLPASAQAIAAACALVQRAELRNSDCWFHDGMQSLGLDQDCALFAFVFKVVHFLGLTFLADIMSMNLESPRDGHELERLSSCLSAEVPLARILHKRFGLDDEASASALFSRLLNNPPAHLSYHDLELCDGLFLHAPQYCSLGLVAWTNRERAQREMITNENMKQNVEARACLTKAEVQILNQKLWDAVESSDVAAAQAAFSMGACADLFLESADKDDPQREDDDSARCQKSKAPLMLFSEYLSRQKFCGDFMNAYGSFPHEIRDGLSTLMFATQKDDLSMMNWLLDVGCNVNNAQPKSYVQADGYEFGGMTALAFARSVDSMNLLLSRGANASATYTPPQYESQMQERSILVGLLRIMSSNPLLRDAMAMALIRHGADVNDVGYPCYDDGQWAGLRDLYKSPPASFWPSVVMRCDVDCAKELLQIYNADPNWPCSFKIQDLYGLGASVLQMAVLKQDKRMIELLLDHGADVNCKEQVFVNFEKFYEHGIENAADIFFLDKAKCLHYWGTSSIDQVSEIDVPEGKKATALSVALANGCNQDIITMLTQAGASDAMISLRSQAPVVFEFLPSPPSVSAALDLTRLESMPDVLELSLHPHPVEKRESVYRSGRYTCDVCGKSGAGWVFHCEECGWDAHPACAERHLSETSEPRPPPPANGRIDDDNLEACYDAAAAADSDEV